jgi:hypothetical protein
VSIFARMRAASQVMCSCGGAPVFDSAVLPNIASSGITGMIAGRCPSLRVSRDSSTIEPHASPAAIGCVKLQSTSSAASSAMEPIDARSLRRHQIAMMIR